MCSRLNISGCWWPIVSLTVCRAIAVTQGSGCHGRGNAMIGRYCAQIRETTVAANAKAIRLA